ncbi:MAG TPA: hypothetical protein VKT49_13470 [Bryobacteraceae bacterium]|nr:hypothetical protein [Bryobacteraceae bacterium]
MKILLFAATTLLLGASTVRRESPFACNREALDAAARHRHFDVLGPALAAARKSMRELPDGYEFEFPPDRATVQKVLEFADSERLCCPFFDIDVRIEREGGSVWLRLTGREGTKQFIQSDFARWMHS